MAKQKKKKNLLNSDENANGAGTTEKNEKINGHISGVSYHHRNFIWTIVTLLFIFLFTVTSTWIFKMKNYIP